MAERVARGKAARADVPRAAHAEFDPGPGAAGPGRPAREPGRDPRARAGADPLRAHAGLAVHLLPRRGPGHGQRPRRDADDRPARPALRRRPPVELRRLRHPRAARWSSTSTTSTRPCPGRSSGTSSGWRRASRSPAATAASPTPSATAVVRDLRRAATATAMADFAGADATSTSSTRASTSRTSFARVPGQPCRASCVKRAEKNVAKARTKDSMQALEQAHPRGRRRAAHHRRPAADRADRGPAARRPGATIFAEWVHARLREYRRTLETDRRRLLERYRVRRPRPQGRRGGQRRARGPGSSCCSAATGATRCSCRSRRPSPRCSRSSPGAASTATPATGWSPASG